MNTIASSTPKQTLPSAYKALVMTCRCCASRRRFLVAEDEAGRVEALYLDREPVLTFVGYDGADGQPYSQCLVSGDISGITTFDLSPAELSVIQREAKAAAVGAAAKVAKTVVSLSGLLPGATAAGAGIGGKLLAGTAGRNGKTK